MTTTTPKVIASTIQTASGPAWRYDVEGGATIVPEWVDVDEAHVRLDLAGVDRYRDRYEVLRAAEEEACLALGYLLPASEFSVGELVEVHAFGHWYRGEIVKVAAKRVTVRFTTGTGASHDKAVNPLNLATRFGSLVRKNDVPR